MNGKNVQGSRLSWKETLSFSSGEMGTNLLFAVTSAYLLVYYTNYAQINPAIVGTIMLSSKIFDAVSDVAMGYIEERFAKPHAKARPWIKRMVVPYAASALLLFAVPEFNSTALQALYVFLTYNLFCTIYTMIVIPYNSLQALITQNEKDREMTGVLRSVFSTIASTIVNSFTMTFEAAGNTKQSWLIVIGAYAVIALAVYVLCYKNTTERVVETKSAEGKEEKLGLKQSLQYVLVDFNNQWNCFQRGYCIEYGIDVLLSGICLSEAAIGCCCRNDLVNADVVFDSVVETDRCKNRNEKRTCCRCIDHGIGTCCSRDWR